MRRARLALLLFLAACDGAALGPLAAVNGVSLMLAQRTVPDLVVSAVSGRDCSLAWLDAGENYCRDPAPATTPPLCTRSIGSVDCWRTPPGGIPAQRMLADGPEAVPPARWPFGRLSIGR